jgi:hypothetical protein
VAEQLTAADRALIEAGVLAAGWLELEPRELAIVRDSLSDAVFALALAMLEADPDFAPRWHAAGEDWVKRGAVLREAVLWVVTPETPTGVVLS